MDSLYGARIRLLLALGHGVGGEPPYAIDGVLHPNPADVYPFGRGRKLGRVPPVMFLAKVESVFVAEH
jgi:hypothetical protein